MPVIFVLGILGIAFEEQIKINKTATALLTCVLLWAILLIDTSVASRTEGFLQYVAHATGGGDTEVSDYLSLRLTEHLGGCLWDTLFCPLLHGAREYDR